MLRRVLQAFLLVLLPSSLAVGANGDLFAQGALWRLQLEIPAQEMKSLRSRPREYVKATLREGTNILRDIGIRLKGASSFQPLDQKPAFTLNCDKFVFGQRFNGLSKFYLNNSLEDPTYVNEKLGSELFSAMGVPAPRVSHALVELNGKRVGLYVLKEGFAPEFLSRYFDRTEGNLFEPVPGVAPDVTDAMELNSGEEPLETAGPKRLARAAGEPDLAQRWIALRNALDIDRFIAFVAMEVLSGHRDGYSLARNNYRLYHDPTSRRFVFMPDGMDQLFGRADFPVRPNMAGVVAKAVLETPEGSQAYSQSLEMALAKCFKADAMTNRVHAWIAAIAPQLPRGEAKTLQTEAADLCERIRQRVAFVERQLAETESKGTR
jgi:hypothetical protein